MEETTRTLHVETIRGDLNRIVDEWLRLHLYVAAIFVVVAFSVEVAMGFFIAQSEILTTSIGRYIIKFIVVPSGLAGICVLAARFTVHGKRVSQKAKIYTMSLLFVLICFFYYSAHSAFIAIYALYAVAIFLTTTYADYKLTGVTTFFSVLSLTGSELFLHWDVDKVSMLQDANRMVNFLVGLSILVGSSIVSNVTIQYERRKNETTLRREVERELLKESMLYDELTGVLNRKALHEELRRLEENVPTEPLVFGIADIDHFKSVNDLYGHHVGDLCLVEFACVLCEYFGETAVYRYGGDEFCVILKNTAIVQAEQLCERAQIRLRRAEFEGVPGLKPTACFGLTQFTDRASLSRLFIQADEALYEAKRSRNAIRVFQDMPATPVSGFRISSQEDVTNISH